LISLFFHLFFRNCCSICDRSSWLVRCDPVKEEGQITKNRCCWR